LRGRKVEIEALNLLERSTPSLGRKRRRRVAGGVTAGIAGVTAGGVTAGGVTAGVTAGTVGGGTAGTAGVTAVGTVVGKAGLTVGTVGVGTNGVTAGVMAGVGIVGRTAGTAGVIAGVGIAGVIAGVGTAGVTAGGVIDGGSKNNVVVDRAVEGAGEGGARKDDVIVDIVADSGVSVAGSEKERTGKEDNGNTGVLAVVHTNVATSGVGTINEEIVVDLT